MTDYLPPFPEPLKYKNFRRDLGEKIAHAKMFYAADIMGMRGGDVTDNPPALSEIYVPLRLHPYNLNPVKQEKKIKEEALHLLTALKEKDRMVIIGPPGAGKSTLVKYIAAASGNLKPTQVNIQLQQRIVLPVILRGLDMDAIDKHNFLHVWAKQFGKVIDYEIKLDLLKFYIDKGWCIFFFDGVDELGPNNRNKLRKIVYAMIKNHSNNKFIITGRPNGFEDCQYDLGPNTQYQVQPFLKEDIATFCKKWFAIRSQGSVDGDNTDYFLQALEKSPALNEMKHRPVYLTMMAIVHETKGRLPHSRAEAYRDILDAYIGQMDALRKVREKHGQDVVPPWPEDDKKRILERLAYDMFLQGLNEEEDEDDPRIQWSREQFENKLTDILEDLQNQPNFGLTKEFKHDPAGTVKKVFDYFIARTGFLAEVSNDLYQFSHLSFQEYLTALHIYRQQSDHPFDLQSYLLKELTERMEYNSWHEVGILFFCHGALVGGGDQTRLLEGITPEFDALDDGFIHFWIKLMANTEHHISNDYRNELWTHLRDWAKKIEDIDRTHNLLNEHWSEFDSELMEKLQNDMKTVYGELLRGDTLKNRELLARLFYLGKRLPGFMETVEWRVLGDWLNEKEPAFDGLILVLDYINQNLPLKRHFKPYFWLDPDAFLIFKDEKLQTYHQAWLNDLYTLNFWVRTVHNFGGNIVNNSNEKIEALSEIFSRAGARALAGALAGARDGARAGARARARAVAGAGARALAWAVVGARDGARAGTLAWTLAWTLARAVAGVGVVALAVAGSRAVAGAGSRALFRAVAQAEAVAGAWALARALPSQKARKLAFWLDQVPNNCPRQSLETLIQIFETLTYLPEHDDPITPAMALHAQKRFNNPEESYLQDVDDTHGDRTFFLKCHDEFFKKYSSWQTFLTMDIPSDGPTVSYDTLADKLEAALRADGVPLEEFDPSFM